MDSPQPFRDLDWNPDRARALGEEALDLWVEFLDRLPSLPVEHALSTDEMRAAVHAEVPEEGWDNEQIIEYLRKIVFDLSMYPGHPGFMAYISGPGTVPGAVADLVAAGINQNVGGWRLAPAATEIEVALTSWFARRFSLPEDAGGLMVSGGSVANFVGLKVGRDVIGGVGLRESGLAGSPPMVIYTSEEVHFATTRAADMLGLGFDAVRMIHVDDDYRLDIVECERRIKADLGAGLTPLAIVATAGSVATGAVDPLERIADLCAKYRLWLHVDAAYGGPAVLADDLRPALNGIERADSIAFDPHKWMYTPHSGGCILVRDLGLLHQSFAPLNVRTYTKTRSARGGGSTSEGSALSCLAVFGHSRCGFPCSPTARARTVNASRTMQPLLVIWQRAQRSAVTSRSWLRSSYQSAASVTSRRTWLGGPRHTTTSTCSTSG